MPCCPTCGPACGPNWDPTRGPTWDPTGQPLALLSKLLIFASWLIGIKLTSGDSINCLSKLLIGKVEGVLEVTLGVVFTKALMGVFENEVAAVAGKISIDVVAEVIGRALIEVSMVVLVGTIGGVFAEILRGNFIIFSISSFCTLFEN